MGSDSTKNDLNRSLEEFENITELVPLQMPNWEMIRAVDALEATDQTSETGEKFLLRI